MSLWRDRFKACAITTGLMLVVICGGSAAPVDVATAATLTVQLHDYESPSPYALHYRAGTREVNALTIRERARSYVFRDSNARIWVRTDKCVPVSGHVARCTKSDLVNRLVVALRDGNDTAAITESDTNVSVVGGSGHDRVTVTARHGWQVWLHGGSGNDWLTRNASGETLMDGGGGDDHLIGGWGDDQLFGDAGDDVIRGRTGIDQLDGGEGNDRLFGGGGGSDAFDLGGGRNFFDAVNGVADSGMDYGMPIECGSQDVARVDQFDRLSGCQHVTRVRVKR